MQYKERYSGVSIPLSPWSKFHPNSRWGAQASTGWGMGRGYPLPKWL